MFDTQALQSKINITDVVSRYRTLVKSGRHFKILCPFHNDHSPSMIVDPEKNFCWCFACQSGGDMFSFIQKIENVSFPESIELIADMAGVPLDMISEKDDFPENFKKTKEEKDQIREVLHLSLQFFQQELKKNNEAMVYVSQKRKLSEKTIQQFEIGFAPKSFHALRDFLLSQKISRQLMLKSGIVQEKEAGEVYDKFRNRIVFPVYDAQGKLCGFGGRSLENEEPKYLNTPETILYKKSEILFGYHLAKNSIRKTESVLLTEGNIDVMTCHQFDIQNTVAVSGTGFSEIQAKMIKRICNTAIIALDHDEAGIRASERILPILFTAGISVKWLEIPNGKDPDESLQNNAEVFKNAIHNAEDALCVLISKKTKGEKNITTEQKRKILGEIFPIVETIPFPLEKNAAQEKISHLLGIDPKLLREEWQAFQKTIKKTEKKESEIKHNTSISQKDFFWGTLLSFYSECNYIFETIEEDFFLNKNEKKLYNILFSAYTTKRGVSFSEIIPNFPSETIETLKKSALFCEEKLKHLSPAQRKQEIKRITEVMGKLLITEQLKGLSPSSPEDVSRMIILTRALKIFQ